MPVPVDLRGRSPLIDRMGDLYDKGSAFVQHPWDSIKQMVMPSSPLEMQHDQEIQRMNQNANDQTVRDANATFLPRRVPRAIPQR